MQNLGQPHTPGQSRRNGTAHAQPEHKLQEEVNRQLWASSFISYNTYICSHNITTIAIVFLFFFPGNANVCTLPSS